MYVLALEASTQSAKAAVVGSDGRCVAQADRAYDADISDIATLDAARVFDVLMEAGRTAVEIAKAQGISDIAAAGLCTIWQSLLPLDASGNPLMRAQTWAHTGAGSLATAFRRDCIRAKRYYQGTGCVPHSQLSLFQAMHIWESEEDIWSRAATLGSLGSYLLGRMTGRHLSPRCTMAGSGWLNLYTHEWDDYALELAGLDAGRLPPLCDATTPLPLLPEVARALGVGDIALAAGGGDGGLNQIGSGALGRGVATCSIGTSSALRIACREPVLTDPPATWCYYIDKGWYVAGASTSGACNCVDWVRERLLAGRPFAELETAMLETRGRWGEAPIFLPFLWGERAPGWDDGRSGGFAGLRGTHGIGDIYYAALEGVLMLLRMCYDRLAGATGIPNVVNLSGGILHSRPWMQMAADVFARPIEISAIKNASLMGAAALALSAGGALRDLADFPVERGEVISPDPAMEGHYRERLARFEEAYRSC